MVQKWVPMCFKNIINLRNKNKNALQWLKEINSQQSTLCAWGEGKLTTLDSNFFGWFLSSDPIWITWCQNLISLKCLSASYIYFHLKCYDELTNWMKLAYFVVIMSIEKEDCHLAIEIPGQCRGSTCNVHIWIMIYKDWKIHVCVFNFR